MKLETLNNSLFAPLNNTEAASVLGGVAAGGAGTFHDCYTFLNDGSYRTDDKDQDKAAELEEALA
jgi:hypothetical protein